MKLFPISFFAFSLLLGGCANPRPEKIATRPSSISSNNGSGKKPAKTERASERTSEIGSDSDEEPMTGEDKLEGTHPVVTKPEPTPVVTKPEPTPVVTKPEPTPVVTKPVEPTPTPEKPSEPADDSCYKGDALTCKIEQLIDEETNRLRATAGKLPLKHRKEISFVSRAWSKEQGDRGKISHDGFPAARKDVYKAEFKTTMDFWAENAAQGNDDGRDAASIAKQLATIWWNSAGHKANMLSDNTMIGTGVYKKGNQYYATQLFSK